MKKELFVHLKKGKQFLIQRENLTVIGIDRVSNDDHLYPDESLEMLRDMNEEYSIVFSREKFGVIREVRDNQTDAAEIYFMKKSALYAYYCDQSIALQKNGKVLHQPLLKVWLQWSGKRVSALQCQGERPFYVEGRTIDGDARYYDEGTYECAEKPRIGPRCAGCPHGHTVGRFLGCKYSVGV